MCWAIAHELGAHACQVAVKHTPCVQKEMSGLYGASERGSVPLCHYTNLRRKRKGEEEGEERDADRREGSL